ncbi:hypothetical protein BXZ70DRAFT_925432 [Cristinia sonorae]|uniref:MARVEL domain-containing protein n=1 Tax=Cristinia sonorae TaxID=1940300 RepID=A0A8K0UVB8_9AGAR|nr:hypothetical protein BXZ70DRAFT_925432 [Cristinia sonorae]
MVQHKLFLVREGVMAALITFSVVVVATNAHYIFITLNDTLFVDGFAAWPQDSPDTFSLFNVAVAGLTILTVPAMLLIERLRRGAFTSMIIFELGWLGTLLILWIASASNTVNSVRFLLALCSLSLNKRVSVLQSACRDVRASEAFGHLAWVSLFGYVSALFFLSYKASQQGKPVWRSAVSETEFHTNFTVPNFNENAGRQDPEAVKDQDPTVDPQNMSYGYPANQPVVYDMSQPQLAQTQQGQPQAPYAQVPYGQAQYGQPQGLPDQPQPQAQPVQAPQQAYVQPRQQI